MKQSIQPGQILTMLWLSVKQDLSVLDAVLWDDDDVTIPAALAPAPQWPRPAHDEAANRGKKLKKDIK